MRLVQTGDKAAFQVLFGRYRDPIWSFVRRRTNDSTAWSDITQDVFFRVWRSAKTFRVEQAFRPWIYRIANNIIRDRHRKHQRTIETQPLEDWSPGRFTDPIATTDLENAIAALPDTLREAFVLGAVQGLNHHEIAHALDISPQNARARVSRARAQLRQLLTRGDQ